MAESRRCKKCCAVMREASYGWVCDPCNRERARAYRLKNLDSVREKDRTRAAAMSAEDRRAKHKRWRDANQEHVRKNSRDAARERYAKDPEKFRQIARDWYSANKEKAAEMRRSNYERHRSERIAYSKAYREANKEAVRRRVEDWRSRNEEHIAKYEQMRRDELADDYVRKVLSGNSLLGHHDIPQSLVEAKRVHLQIKRLLRKEKQK